MTQTYKLFKIGVATFVWRLFCVVEGFNFTSMTNFIFIFNITSESINLIMWNFITILKKLLIFFCTSQLCTCQLGEWKCFTKFENKFKDVILAPLIERWRGDETFLIKNNNSFGTWDILPSKSMWTIWKGNKECSSVEQFTSKSSFEPHLVHKN